MGDYFVCSKTDPVVETKAGKVRGFRLNTTYAFHGIHYAEADRFQMPQPVKPWKGIKNALAYGYVCPLLKQDEPNMEVLVPHRYWPQDEHCQNLNVWTQSLDPGAKKPVMVWLHGGGFSAGSAIEHVAYEGDHLSEFGDVVVVSVNHRLNILGYLDLSPFGEKYKNSANAGNADMVAALQWVHDNIAAFGGDPENVTIFGQSGGGMKVATLMNTPAADGLFQKGIIESGVYEAKVYQKEDGDGTAIVKALLKELNLDESEVEKLETIPYYELSNAYNKVEAEVAAKGCYIGQGPMENGWFHGNPIKCGFTDHAKSIPVLAGTNIGGLWIRSSARQRSNSFVRNRSLQKRRPIPISLPMNSRSMAEKPHGIVPRFRSYSITSTALPYAMSRAKQTVCRSVWPPPGSTLPATEARKPHPSRTGRHAPQGMKQP